MRRSPMFMMYHAVMPMCMIVGLSLLTFWLPIQEQYAGNGERISFSVTLLLTIMATTLFTAESRTHSYVTTWLDRFQGCCITITIVPIVETLVAFYIHNIRGQHAGDEAAAAERAKLATEIDPVDASPRKWLQVLRFKRNSTRFFFFSDGRLSLGPEDNLFRHIAVVVALIWLFTFYFEVPDDAPTVFGESEALGPVVFMLAVMAAFVVSTFLTVCWMC